MPLVGALQRDEDLRDYAGRMELIQHFWDATVVLDPAAVDLDEGKRSPICHPDQLTRLWREAGLAEVTVCGIDVPAVFPDFDDYWTPFLGGQGRPRRCLQPP